MIYSQTRSGYSVNIPNSFNHFNIIKILGIGSSSIVCLGEDQNTNKKYSAKVIPKAYIKKAKLMNHIEKEIAIMRELDHPNIVKIHKSFEITNKNKESYLVLLMEYIQEREFESETQKQQIIRGSLNAIKYLHERGISHGDILA